MTKLANRFSLGATAFLAALALIGGECGAPPVEKWTFGIGGESPGAQGNMALLRGMGFNGETAIYMEGAFGLGGLYVFMDCKLDSPCDAKTIKFMVKSSDLESLNVRLRDSGGQTHQRRIPLKDTDSWQEALLKPEAIQKEIHFGGANDGKWRPPLTGVSILLSKSSLKDGLKSGKIQVSGFKLQ